MTTKLCPFCAEEIKEATIVCKHCGRELDPQGVASATRELDDQIAEESQAGDRFLHVREFDASTVLAKHSPKEEIVRRIQSYWLRQLKEGAWVDFFHYPLAKVDPRKYIDWGEKLFKESFLRGDGSVEGAINWLSENSPKFGFLKPMKNYEGEFAAEALKRGLYRYTKEEAKGVWKRALGRVIEDAVKNSEPEEYKSNVLSATGYTLKEVLGEGLAQELQKDLIQAALELVETQKESIESGKETKRIVITKEMLDNPSTALEHIYATRYRHELLEKTVREVIDWLLDNATKMVISDDDAKEFIASRLDEEEYLPDYANELTVYQSVRDGLERDGYKLKTK